MWGVIGIYFYAVKSTIQNVFTFWFYFKRPDLYPVKGI